MVGDSCVEIGVVLQCWWGVVGGSRSVLGWSWVEELGGGFLRSFLFQAEDGIRGAQESRGLGGVYKGQEQSRASKGSGWVAIGVWVKNGKSPCECALSLHYVGFSASNAFTIFIGALDP